MYYALPLVIGLLALAAAWAGALWWFKRRTALRTADETFEDWTRESPHALRGLDHDQFRAAFMRAHGARGQATVAVALAGVILLTPVALLVLQGGWYALWVLAGRAPYYAEGLLIWQFSMFFGIAAVWTAIAAVAARIHHKQPAGTLSEEILRESSNTGAARA